MPTRSRPFVDDLAAGDDISDSAHASRRRTGRIDVSTPSSALSGGVTECPDGVVRSVGIGPPAACHAACHASAFEVPFRSVATVLRAVRSSVACSTISGRAAAGLLLGDFDSRSAAVLVQVGPGEFVEARSTEARVVATVDHRHRQGEQALHRRAVGVDVRFREAVEERAVVDRIT